MAPIKFTKLRGAFWRPATPSWGRGEHIIFAAMSDEIVVSQGTAKPMRIDAERTRGLPTASRFDLDPPYEAAQLTESIPVASVE